MFQVKGGLSSENSDTDTQKRRTLPNFLKGKCEIYNYKHIKVFSSPIENKQSKFKYGCIIL